MSVEKLKYIKKLYDTTERKSLFFFPNYLCLLLSLSESHFSKAYGISNDGI